jgi:hypothetical protein
MVSTTRRHHFVPLESPWSIALRLAVMELVALPVPPTGPEWVAEKVFGLVLG